MLTHNARREVHSGDRPDFCDVTEQVQAELDGSGIRHGQVTVFSPDDCSILINERESGLLEDLRRVAQRVEDLPGTALGLGSQSAVIPVVDGKLHLGTWQRILLVSLDGNGAKHELLIEVVGED